MEYPDNLEHIRQLWDSEAERFDNEPDHGLRDPVIRATWMELLKQHLPLAPASVVDIGCGTGSLSVLLAELGYTVTGIDLSPAMIALAERKAAAAGFSIQFGVMDAFVPQLSTQQFDVVLCRHLLWALPDPVVALQRWAELLRENGRFLLIEGFWHTGGGLHASQVIKALPASFAGSVQNLSQNAALWGGPVTDERYIVTAQS